MQTQAYAIATPDGPCVVIRGWKVLTPEAAQALAQDILAAAHEALAAEVGVR